MSYIEIGYWKEPENPRSALPDPRDHVDPSWDREERAHVVAYLRLAPVCRIWRGRSYCRFCQCANGSKCLSDGKYIWPSGFAHYVQKHDVRPPQDFIDHALRGSGLDRRSHG